MEIFFIFANEHSFMFCTVQLQKGDFEIQMILERNLGAIISSAAEMSLVFSPITESQDFTGCDKIQHVAI